MKNFVRCILIGVCISLGYGLTRASTQVSVDTIDKCYAPGERIQHDVIDSEFYGFLNRDKALIKKQGGQVVKYEVEYEDFQYDFSGEGIDDKESTESLIGIGNATIGLRNQYISCTIIYTRVIRFDTVDMGDYFDSEDAISKQELLGEKKNGFPEFVLKSKREWHAVIRIRKKLTSNDKFSIAGSPCMVNGKTTLSLPEDFADIHCVWKSEGNNDAFSDSNAHTVTVTRVNGTVVETTIRYELTGCSNEKSTGTIQLRPNQTPASTITLNDCLPTTIDTIEIVATNPLSGVRFQWGNVQPMIAETMPFSQKVVYPVSGVADFTVTLITQGGCNSSQTTRKVHRKLSDNVKLQILDSCLTSKIPFRVVTDPPLIGVPLRWMIGQSDYTVEPIEKNRIDRVKITRNKAEGGWQNITVMDANCNGSISQMGFISEAYTEMVVKTETGLALPVGGMVPSGMKIIFTAPQHSSITGYSWMTRYSGIGPIKFWEGPAEISVTPPSEGGSVTVSVSYTSCFGRQSKTYRLQTTNGSCRLFEE